VALLSAWIAVGDSDSTASVDSGPLLVRLAAALWFVAIALRRFAPATCLAAAAVATVLAAAVDEPLTNLSLASALALAMVVRTRPAAAAALLAVGPVAAALAALLTSPEGRSTWALAALVHLAAALWGVSSRRAARNRARVEQLSREQAVHAERARLALDLHDAIGHAVTRMLTCAGAARCRCRPVPTPRSPPSASSNRPAGRRCRTSTGCWACCGRTGPAGRRSRSGSARWRTSRD
jgi:signal transduction histidine kinase